MPHDRPTGSTQWDSGIAGESAVVPLDHSGAIDPAPTRALHVAVIGAGVFGAWTALHLLRAGATVTLVDAWGPGNARSSSGGDTRAIRGVYGADGGYVAWMARSLQMWRAFEAECGETLFRRTGVLWMVGPDERYVRASLPHLSACGLSFDELGVRDAAVRFPQVNFEGVAWVLLEHDAGLLYARLACRAIRDRFVAEGGRYVRGAVRNGGDVAGSTVLTRLTLSDGTTLPADRFVFACGPWLGELFPEAVGDLIAATRQEIHYFGTPAGDARFHERHLPVWIDLGEPVYYGFPMTSSHEFKIGDDTRGPPIDPSRADRSPDLEAVQRARTYLRFRFPALASAPLIDARVCQYANTPDGHFIIDRHPAADNVWLLGGGSGHGFKLGPVVGHIAARLVATVGLPDRCFSLQRFQPT